MLNVQCKISVLATVMTPFIALPPETVTLLIGGGGGTFPTAATPAFFASMFTASMTRVNREPA